MVWKITPTFSLDSDAAAYIAAVEAADGQALEVGTRYAINNFVIGCKADGIWTAIKASCILAGARTLNGALVPLVGTAPTNFNFVSGDYNRKTGLLGNGSTKYLDSNRLDNVDPQNSQHIATFVSVVGTGDGRYMAARSSGTSLGQTSFGLDGAGSSEFYSRFNQSAFNSNAIFQANKLAGLSRNAASTFSYRLNSTTSSISIASVAPTNTTYAIFRSGAQASRYANARLAFYSIGESIDLALLDARVTDLINALAAAIP